MPGLPGPLPGELLRSWLVRRAHDLSLPPLLFGRSVGVVAARWAVSDGLLIDRQTRTVLADVTGIESPVTMDPWHAARIPWLDRCTRACGPCLDESDGAFLAVWRLPWVLDCPKHGIRLEDRCPACGHRIGSGAEPAPSGRLTRPGEVRHPAVCAVRRGGGPVCTFDLRNLPTRPSPSGLPPVGTGAGADVDACELSERAAARWRRLTGALAVLLAAESPRATAPTPSPRSLDRLIEDTDTLRAVLPRAAACADGTAVRAQMPDNGDRRPLVRAHARRWGTTVGFDGRTVDVSYGAPARHQTTWDVLPQALSAGEFGPFRRWFALESIGRAYVAYWLARRLTGADWAQVLRRLGTPWEPEPRLMRHRRRIAGARDFHTELDTLADRWARPRYRRNHRRMRELLRSDAARGLDPRTASWAWEELGGGDIRLRPPHALTLRAQHYRRWRTSLSQDDHRRLACRVAEVTGATAPDVWTRTRGALR